MDRLVEPSEKVLFFTLHHSSRNICSEAPATPAKRNGASYGRRCKGGPLLR